MLISQVIFNNIGTNTFHYNQIDNTQFNGVSMIEHLYKQQDDINYCNNDHDPREDTSSMSSDQMQGIIITDIIKINNNNVRDDRTLCNSGTYPYDNDGNTYNVAQ